MKDICKRCGMCCYPRKKIEDKIIIDFSDKCFFMADDNSCKVYKDRFEKCKEIGRTCLNRKDVKINIPNCPYNKEGNEEVSGK